MVPLSTASCAYPAAGTTRMAATTIDRMTTRDVMDPSLHESAFATTGNSPNTPHLGNPWRKSRRHSTGAASLLHPNAAAALGTPRLAALLLPQILPDIAT